MGWWLLAALGACTPLGLWLYADPAFEVSEVRLEGEEPRDSSVTVALFVWNPNAYELMTARFELQLEVDGLRVGSYARDSIIPVPRAGTASLSLPFLAPSGVRGELEELGTGTHRFALQGRAFFTTPFGEREVPVAHAGDLDADSASGAGGDEEASGGRARLSARSLSLPS